MHFAVLPPEVNSGRMYAGPGAGSMLAAATAWDELANELHTTAANIESVVSEITAEPWQGPSSASMATAAAPQLEWLNTTAAQANQASVQAKAAAAAYESAFAMTVPPAVVASNRAELTSLTATNLVGQNAAAIAANEVAYSEMWAQDVTAMYSYAGESKAAAQVSPFTPPQQTTNQEGLGAQAAATSQAAGAAAGHAQSAVSSGQAMSAVPNALQTLGTSTDLSQFSNPYDLISLGSGLFGNGLGLLGFSGTAGFVSDAEHKIVGTKVVSAPQEAEGGAAPRPPEQATTVSAGRGRADALGKLSVPQGWASGAPEMRLVASQSPTVAPAPAGRPGLPGGMPLFGGAPLMSLAGREGSDSRNRPGDKVAAVAPAAAASYGRAEKPAGQGTRTNAELREVTELLGKLADLRASGALTDNEFSEQKQRLLGGR